MTLAADERRLAPPEGVSIDFLEWRYDLVSGAAVELMEIIPGEVSLTQIFIRPGTVLQLEQIEELEYKIAL